MIIRKRFSYEMSHRVVGAFTKRCSQNIHGHSYTLELLFSGNKPDAAQMVMDFGFVKKFFHPFVDSFDHAHALWYILPETGLSVSGISATEVENEYITGANERYILLPFSSTAEMQAKMFCVYAREALANLQYHGLVCTSVKVDSAIVHETVTGYAQYFEKDLSNGCCFPEINLNTIDFSEGIKNEWSQEFKEFYQDLLG